MWSIISIKDFVLILGASLFRILFPDFSLFPNLWEALPPATCMPDHCFCEPVVHGLISQPVNTWSNLAFILAGVMTLTVAAGDFSVPLGKRDSANLMRSQRLYPFIYASAAILIGLGSLVYHASMVFYAQVADILGMYLLSTFMALYNLSRAFKLKGRTFFGAYLSVNLVLGIVSTVWPLSRRPIFVGILIIILLSELLVWKVAPSRKDMKMLLPAMVSLVIACISWLLDTNGIFCLPDSWIQLHSFWHIGMAAAIWFLYQYYRSEQPSLEKVEA